MPDALMYSDEDTYVVLETDQPEQIVTAVELLTKLESVLSVQQDELPQEIEAIPTISEQARYLLATSCELDLGPSQFLQWYVVRLEK